MTQPIYSVQMKPILLVGSSRGELLSRARHIETALRVTLESLGINGDGTYIIAEGNDRLHVVKRRMEPSPVRHPGEESSSAG